MVWLYHTRFKKKKKQKDWFLQACLKEFLCSLWGLVALKVSTGIDQPHPEYYISMWKDATSMSFGQSTHRDPRETRTRHHHHTKTAQAVTPLDRQIVSQLDLPHLLDFKSHIRELSGVVLIKYNRWNGLLKMKVALLFKAKKRGEHKSKWRYFGFKIKISIQGKNKRTWSASFKEIYTWKNKYTQIQQKIRTFFFLTSI